MKQSEIETLISEGIDVLQYKIMRAADEHGADEDWLYITRTSSPYTSPSWGFLGVTFIDLENESFPEEPEDQQSLKDEWGAETIQEIATAYVFQQFSKSFRGFQNMFTEVLGDG